MSNLRIVDAQGRPIPRSEVENEGASYGRRMATWGISSSGPNATLWGDLSSLRSRTRRLTRNNPLAENGVESLVSNLIGTGIIPRWQIKDSAMKEEVQQLWDDWSEESDFYGVSDIYGQQSTGARCLVESGEVLARFVMRNNDTVPLQIQLIEPDHLDVSYESIAPNGNKIRMGIEFNSEGRRVAYHLFKDHPGETFLFNNSFERIRVPASEILHVFRPLRPGQMRGRPWLSSIIVKLHEIDQYSDAEIVRKKAAAMFGGFIIEPPGELSDMSSLGRVGDNDVKDNPVLALEPGTFPKLKPGMDVRFSLPADVGGNYLVWIKQQLREIAAGMGITYEQLTGDLEGVNYSSIRAGLLEFRRRCEALQWNIIIFQFCQPVAKRWLDVAVGSGKILIPGYFRNRREYTRIDWRPQGWKWVDPLKDGMAAQLAVRCGFTSRSAVVAEQGYDAEMVDRQVSEDNVRADESELIYDSDPRKTQKSGTSQAAETTVMTGVAGQ